jgi:anti-anti-sigma factor
LGALNTPNPNAYSLVRMAAAREPTFKLQTVVSTERHTLVLSGDLDSRSAVEFESLVRRVCAEGTQAILVDITRLSFLDSSGLGAILRAQKICDEHGVGFMLTPGERNVQRVFEITGMVDELPFLRSAPS